MAIIEREDKGAHFLLVVACAVVVVAGIRAAGSLILPFLVSVFIAMISVPLLNWLQSLRIPRPLAVLLTLVAAISVVAGFVIVIGNSITRFTAQVPKYKVRLDVMFGSATDFLQAHGINLSDQISTDLLSPSRALDVATGTLGAVTAALSNLALVFLTITFILFEAACFPDKLRAAFGGRENSERFMRIRTQVRNYLGIKTLLSLCTGACVSVGMALLGVDFPLLWGALAFLLNYIPTLGSIIAAIPPVLLATVQLGPGYAVAVAVVFAVVNVTFGSLLEPYMMGRRLGLSTLVVFLSLVFWGWIWGPVGMLLSVPLTMILKIMMENTEDLRWIAVLLDASPAAPSAEAAGGQAGK